MTDETRAVIDLGSNSVRLVIYQMGPHGTQHEIENVKETIRLSSHLDDNNNITQNGIELTVRVLSQFKELCDAYEVKEIIGVATQAVRVALNRDELLNRIVSETGIDMRVLSGKEEAHYGYLAVVNSIPLDEGVTVDVGGGSTEITYFRNRKLLYSISIPYGAVSLTKACITSDPPSQKDLKSMERAVGQQLTDCTWLNGLRCPVIGVGGTARAIARIHQRRRQYQMPLLHGYEISPTEVAAVFDMVSTVSGEKRSQINGLSGDRVDIITAGTAIINEVLKLVEASLFVISDKGLRDGILAEQVLQARNHDIIPDMLMYSIENIQDQFRMNGEHAHHVWKMSQKLHGQLVKSGWMSGSEDGDRRLKVAALLYGIGRTISLYNTSSHNFYLILHIPLVGISHRERVMAAGIASFKTTKQLHATLADYQAFLTEEDFTTVAQFGALLGLVESLNRPETGRVEDLQVLRKDGAWVLQIQATKGVQFQVNRAAEWVKKWRKVFQQEIQLEVTQRGRAKDV